MTMNIRTHDAPQTPAEARAVIVAASVDKLYTARGIFLSGAEYLALAQGIRSGLYKQVASDHRGQPVYEIPYRDVTLHAVWSPTLDCVRTFLGRKIVDAQTGPRAGQESPRWKRLKAAAAAFKPTAEGGIR